MTQSALPKSEDLYRTLFVNSHSPMLVIDPETARIVDANPAACSFYGYSREELTTRRITDFSLFSEEEVFREIVLARSGGAQRLEQRHRLANGAVREVEVHSSPTRVQGRELLFSVIHDVTERKRAEEALAAEHRRLLDIIEFLPDATFVIDKEKKVTAWNRAIEALTGVKKEEMLGKGDYAYAVPFFGAPRPILIDLVDLSDPEVESGYKYVRRSGSVVCGEVFIPRLKKVEGVHLWAVAAPLFDHDGKRCGAIEAIRDVTGLNAAEDALRLSAQRWQTTFDAINDAICLMNNEDRILQCNRAMIELVGKPSEAIIGQRCYELVHGSDTPLPGCPMVTMRRTRQREQIEISRGDRWFNFVADPIFDENDGIIGTVHTLCDITSKKLAEETLNQRSNEMAALARLFRATTTQRNLQRILEEALHGALTLTGLDAGVLCLVDGNTGWLQPRVMANVSDTLRTALGGQMLAAGGRLCSFGAQTGLNTDREGTNAGDKAVSCDGAGCRDIRFHATFPLRVHNETIGDLCLFSCAESRPEPGKLELVQEISGPVALAIEHVRLYEEVQRYASDLEARVTERTAQLQREIAERRLAEGALRQSERKYRELVENANSIILRMDAEGRVTFLNEFGQRFFGYVEEEIVGRDVVGTIVPETDGDGRDLRQMIQELARDPERYARNENENIRANGERVWIAWTNKPVFDAVGHLSGCLCIGNDITELKNVERELLQARDAAEAADRIKSAFLATMSHELRTPLNSIIGFTGILLQELAGPLNTEQHRQLGMVQKSSRHLLQLINDVLDISKIEAGQLELAWEPFNLRKAIVRAVQLVSPLAAEKGVGLELDVSEEVGEIVSDQRRLEQIIINLLSNAVKFTDHGHIEIRCRVDNDQIVLSVRDTGMGMLPEDLETIFRPFHQIDTGLTRKHDGSGLGLTICNKLVEMMAGGIQVESEWGAGSTFTVRLPQIKGNRPWDRPF